jgi:hypothetical protein
MESQEKLPHGWIKVKSKSRSGMSYFYNPKTKESVWKLSELSPEKSVKMRSSPPKKPSGVVSKSINIGKKNIAESRMKNLKMALEKERNEVLCDKHELETKSNHLPKPKKKPTISPKKQTYEKKKKLESPRKRVEEKVKRVLSIESMDVDMTSLSQEQRTNPEDYVEPMDWEEIAIEEVVKEVNNIRSIKSVSSSLMPSSPHAHISHDNDKFYIVVDTNVFCSNPQFIDRIKGRMFKGKIYFIFKVS